VGVGGLVLAGLLRELLRRRDREKQSLDTNLYIQKKPDKAIRRKPTMNDGQNSSRHQQPKTAMQKLAQLASQATKQAQGPTSAVTSPSAANYKQRLHGTMGDAARQGRVKMRQSARGKMTQPQIRAHNTQVQQQGQQRVQRATSGPAYQRFLASKRASSPIQELSQKAANLLQGYAADEGMGQVPTMESQTFSGSPQQAMGQLSNSMGF
jgi:hypothetical protein